MFASETSWRHLQDMSWRRLQDMSSRRLQEVFSVIVFSLPRCLQDVLREVLKTSSNCYAEDVLKMSSRHVLNFFSNLLQCLYISSPNREIGFSVKTSDTCLFNDFISFSPCSPFSRRTSIWVVVVTVLLSIVVVTFWYFLFPNWFTSSFNRLMIDFGVPLISISF